MKKILSAPSVGRSTDISAMFGANTKNGTTLLIPALIMFYKTGPRGRVFFNVVIFNAKEVD